MTPTNRRGRRAALSAAAVVLCLSGGGLVAYGMSQQDDGPPTPPKAGSEPAADVKSAPPGSPRATPSRSGAARGEAYVRPQGQVLDRSGPTEVRIPSIDVDGRTIDLGTTGDQRMEVPQNGSDIGWYEDSPTPGELGPSVIAAHVTWKGARGVFYDLGAMKPKDRIEVDRQDGTTAIFRVDRVERYPKAKFPTQKVYGATDRAALRLITCGGAYDKANERHLDNVVVYAQLVSSERSRS